MRAFIPSGLVLLLGLACATEDLLGPSDVAGTYNATTFDLVHNADTTDVLAAGGSLLITLMSNGSTSGHLTVPASLAGGTEFNADLPGTFTISRDTLRFAHAADTFVRDLSLSIVVDGAAASLTGSATFSDTTVVVVLERGGILIPQRRGAVTQAVQRALPR